MLKQLEILFFCTIIWHAVTNEGKEVPKADLEPFLLDEFLNGTFRNRGWNGTWISDTAFLARNQEEDIYIVDASVQPNPTAKLFIAANELKRYPGNSVTITSDQKFALVRYNQRSVFRHSTTAQYAIFDIENRIHYDVAEKTHLQLAQWAPVGTGLVYVLDNNILYIQSPLQTGNPVKITNDGRPGEVYNGVPDWVYEEEVLGSGSALWFSPDGKNLAFASFHDELVEKFHYFMYGQPGDLENQYPEVVTLRYPKVGTTNPKVSVKYVNLDDPTKVVQTLTKIIPVNIVSKEHVLNDVTWASNKEVVAVSLNRVQNLGAITRCNIEDNSCQVETTIKQNGGWLDLSVPKYNADGSKFILILSEPEKDDYFKHIVLFDTITNTRTRLTKGQRVVSSIYGWDQTRNLIYYLGTVEDYPMQQQVYVFNLNTATDHCLTCNFQTAEGPCKVATASFSKSFGYLAKTCSGPGPGTIHVENSQNGNFFVWEHNLVLREQLKNKFRPKVKDLKVKLQNGFVVRARLLLPPSLNESSIEKYPMIVNVYAGPNSNRITDAFSTGIENYFVTNRNYIYAYIDARGCGKNGDNLMFQIYRRMGTVEIEDQIAVTKFLQDTFPYIDANRTGIWGWSYGGFATLWALIKDKQNVFKLGLSVAPVTNFIYYDSIYTERYMGLPTPDDNLLGYIGTDATIQVEGLRNKKFFLIHGNADDNVHYQQSMMLSKSLERADILFLQQSYPDENHALGGVSAHLYHTIDQFFHSGFRANFPKKWKVRKGKHARHAYRFKN